MDRTPLLTTVVIAFVTTTMLSCQKVIDVKINNAAQTYVIEGTVPDTLGYPTVKISRTLDFQADDSFVAVSGATVSIQVNATTTYSLIETIPGIYTTTAFSGTPGNAFALNVLIDGQSFTSSSTMPAHVNLDSIRSENLDFGGSNTITIVPYYTDPPGPANHYYRFVEYDNGTQVQAVFVQNDNLSHGLQISEPLINSDGKIKTGDQVLIQMQSIDSTAYKYWFSLGQSSTGNNQSAAPANPVSNITGGCLGYFSAYSISQKSLIIP